MEFNALEAQVLDSQPLQRLRFVKQLATAYLVFPSAQHTRFEHSVGAMHLTGEICRKLNAEPAQFQLLRLAALLHDVGHPAFSHETEEVLRKATGEGHEERGARLVEESGLANAVEKAGFSARELKNLLAGRGWGSVLTDDLGADRIDYLMRDAHFTGVAYSLIDADRLLQTMAVHDGRVVVTEKGRMAAESLLTSRYFMFNVVYYHPTVRIAGEMVAKTVAAAIRDEAITAEGVAGGTDYGVLERLQEAGYPLASRVFERKLFKKALVVDTAAEESASKFFSSKNALAEVEGALAAAGFAEGEFAACMPLVHTKEITAKLLSGGKLCDLQASSSLVRALQAERREGHFVLGVDERRKTQAAEAVLKLF
ncbi:MAG: HD domain-containing protein, partial [Candidatus Micrarchaeota archaeon]